MNNLKFTAILVSTALFAASAGYVVAQPEAGGGKGRGVSSTEIARVDLGKYFKSMSGKWMLMTRADVTPGGGSTPHSHNKRPEVVYVLKGDMVETQGAEKHIVRAGEGQQSNANMNEKHQFANAGAEEASVLVIEIVCSAGTGALNNPDLKDCGTLGINN
jgi:quercetin dioxygenase-like cupin family protein